MPKFIVVTEETVTGEYLIEAKDEEEARGFFRTADKLKEAWDSDKIEQVSYQTSLVEVDDIRAAE